MKKILLFILPILTLLSIVSCQKELNDPTVTAGIYGPGGSGGGGTGSSTITGTWKFVSMTAITQSIAQTSGGGIVFKTITNSDYTSTNNTGTMVITSNTMTGNGIGYAVSDTAFALSYENGVLIDTTSQLFNITVPPTNSSATYKQINQDSIYINPTATSIGTGYHIALNGNILTMTASVVRDTTINVSGVLASQHESATAITTLQRQ